MRRSLQPVLLAVALSAVSLPAQLRKPCFGTVVDADGKLLCGAEVTLVWTPGMGAPGELDIVRAVTDARGRFKADLVLGHGYSAWAIGPAMPDGSRLVSEVTDRAAPGVVVELAAWQRWQPQSLRVDGAAAWSGDPTPRLVLFPCAGNALTVDLPGLQGGEVALPPRPWTDAAVAVCDAAGTVLCTKTFSPGSAPPTVEFAPPSQLEVVVEDAAGAPVAGARVELLVSTYGTGGDDVVRPHCAACWRPAATTGADGAARVQVPRKSANSWLRAGQQGTGWHYAPTQAATPGVAGGPQQLRLTLRPMPAASGQVRGLRAGDLPLAQALVQPPFRAPGNIYVMALALPCQVDNGSIAVEHVPTSRSQTGLVLHLLPRAEGTPRYVLTSPIVDPPAQLPSIDLAKLRQWELRVVDAGNNPLPGAAVMVFRTSEQPPGGVMPATNYFVLDHAGRADLSCDDREWGIYVSTGMAHVLHFIDAGNDGGELRLRLESMPVLRCQVVDKDGRPVRWARAESSGGGGFAGALRGARGWAKERVAMNIALSSARAVRSDGDGMLVLPVQDWRPMTMPVRVRAGDLVSEPFPLASSDDVREVVVR